ncbi:MAG: TlpA family protein disulfide reductase [Lachnospiraceae bacterium]|jgi:thiol-disulfide isomerase/thioredoxin|nr:TlpA disulfide reductase family protein [uncultured Acetatifactor sp.]MCI9221252.1 TlpA family protein disulfide reductase [Lachnospiraceae bacterium]
MFSVKKKFVLLVCLILAGLLCGCAGKDSGDAAPEKNVGSETDETLSTEETKQEPTVVFEAQDMEGNTVTSDIFGQSRLTMINVWATYCNPCLSEMPELGELAGEYDEGDFRLIGVISDVPEMTEGMVDADKVEKAIEVAKSLIERTGADYTHLLLNASLFNALLTDVTAVPTTFFVDEEGRVLGEVVGARDKESWKKMIDALLEEL